MSNIPLTDLRIGNLLNCNQYGNDSEDYDIVKVIALNSYFKDSHVSYELINGHDVSDDCMDHFLSGIPISEEWLERFGFYKTKSGYFEHIKHSFQIWDDNLYTFYNGVFTPVRIGIKYVHILQNVVFFTAGTELTLKQ